MAGRTPLAAGAAAAAAALLLGAALAPPAAAHGGGPDVFVGDEAIYTVAWNPDGTRFAVGTSTGNISIYDGIQHTSTPVVTWHAHDGPLNQVAFAPNGTELVSSSGSYKDASTERDIKVWSLAPAGAPALRLNLSGHYDWIPSVVYSPDGRFIASSSGIDDHEDATKAFGEVFVWDAINGGPPVWQAAPLDSYPHKLAWAPDGSAVAAMGHLSDIWLLNVTTREKLRISPSFRDDTGHASHGWAIAWSPDSRYVVGGFSRDLNQDGSTDRGPVVVFDTHNLDASGLAPLVREAYNHTKPVQSVAWDSTGQYIASCSGADVLAADGSFGSDGVVDVGETIIYNVTRNPGLLTEVQTFRGGFTYCSAVAWRPSNLTVLAGNGDGSSRLYILDADGDGCLTWDDELPFDPTSCALPPVATPGLLESPAQLLAVVGGAAAIAAAVSLQVLLKRRERRRAQAEEAEARRGRRRDGGKRHSGGRRGARR